MRPIAMKRKISVFILVKKMWNRKTNKFPFHCNSQNLNFWSKIQFCHFRLEFEFYVKNLIATGHRFRKWNFSYPGASHNAFISCPTSYQYFLTSRNVLHATLTWLFRKWSLITIIQPIILDIIVTRILLLSKIALL